MKTFDSADLNQDDNVVELVIEGLDSRADIFVNGQFIKTHRSVHYPFVYGIKSLLKEGENDITIRLTSGLEDVNDQDLSELNGAVCTEDDNGGKDRGDKRRSFVRRPQYNVGWDWGPRAVSIGITGDAFIRSYRSVAIREVKMNTVEIGTQAFIKATVNIENLGFISTLSGDVEIRLMEGGIECTKIEKKAVLLTSGYNYVEFDIIVADPKLWWPSGYGEQPLYEVEVRVTSEASVEVYPTFSYGIRTIQLDTDILQGEHRKFSVVVNQVPIYCKGGNWVPNDFIYARVPDEKYEVLLDEAVEANFNMMRIWGGGLYEKELFYQLCDKKGILIWHDFMFACATYPDHQQWFREEVREEFDYQTKRLRNHASMALWCGTNEVHWIFNSTDNPRWNIEFEHEHQYGLYIANIVAKEIIQHNCAETPYWNSSPYGGNLPNDDSVGDVHRWHNALMSLKMEDRIEVMDYDNLDSKFVSEYGFIGLCCIETIQEYMDGHPLDRESDVWKLHCNVFERDTVHVAIEKNYEIEDASSLPMEDYILHGGMVHSIMYEYSLESMRFKDHCYGGLFWMYNDAWGEVGWTIIDYYLRRKIPYYGVKRALAHQKLIMREEEGAVIVKGYNDSSSDITLEGEFGYVSFDGAKKNMKNIPIHIPARTCITVLKEQLPEGDYKKGTVMLMTNTSKVDNIWLRKLDICKMEYTPSAIEIIEETVEGQDKKLRITTTGFAHGVYIEGNYDCSDAYFDLLAGTIKELTVKNIGNEKVYIKTVK